MKDIFMSTTNQHRAIMLWQDYLAKASFKKRLITENFTVQPLPAPFNDHQLLLTTMAGLTFEQAKPAFKAVMTKSAFGKLCDSFRAYTYKLRHGRTNISLSRETLKRLIPIAEKLGLVEQGRGLDGGIDNLLYYLTCPNEQQSVQAHLSQIAADKTTTQSVPDAVPLETWLYLFKQRIAPHEQVRLQLVLEQSFSEGWFSRDQSKLKSKSDFSKQRATVDKEAEEKIEEAAKNEAKIINAFHGINLPL